MPSKGKHLDETDTANVAFSDQQWNFCLKFGFHFPLEGMDMFTHIYSHTLKTIACIHQAC